MLILIHEKRYSGLTTHENTCVINSVADVFFDYLLKQLNNLVRIVTGSSNL